MYVPLASEGFVSKVIKGGASDSSWDRGNLASLRAWVVCSGLRTNTSKHICVVLPILRMMSKGWKQQLGCLVQLGAAGVGSGVAGACSCEGVGLCSAAEYLLTCCIMVLCHFVADQDGPATSLRLRRSELTDCNACAPCCPGWRPLSSSFWLL